MQRDHRGTPLEPAPLRIPPNVQGYLDLFAARGHTVKVRQNRHGSNRYTLDHERERTAFELCNRFDRLYP